MPLGSTSEQMADRANEVRSVLPLLSDLLNASQYRKTLELPPDSRDGLSILLFSCALTLENIE